MNITYSILSAPALAAEVAREYDIAEPTICHLQRRALSDTYALTTSSDEYLLRVYRASHSASAVAFELGLLAHLASAGLPVSSPLPAKDGRTAVSIEASEGVRHLALFRYLPGEPFDSTSLEQWRTAGQLLARVHAAASEFICAAPHSRLDATATIDQPLAAIRPFFAARAADWEFVESTAAALRARVDRMGRAGLDWGVCHGSFNAKAMRLSAAGTLELGDFESCAEGWRAWDLAGLLWSGRRQNQAIAQSDQREVIWDHFAEGYAATRTLAEDDRAAAPTFVAIRHFATLGMYAEKVDEWGIRHMAADTLDRWLDFLRDCRIQLEDSDES